MKFQARFHVYGTELAVVGGGRGGAGSRRGRVEKTHAKNGKSSRLQSGEPRGGGQEWRQRAAEKQGVFQASIGEGALAPSCRAPQGHDQIRGDFQHDIAVEMEEKERLHTLPFPEDPWSLTFLCKHIELIAYRIGSISNATSRHYITFL